VSDPNLLEILDKLERQAQSFADLLNDFASDNVRDRAAAMTLLEGTKTTTKDDVKSALDNCTTAIENARKLAEDAAAEARSLAHSIRQPR